MAGLPNRLPCSPVLVVLLLGLGAATVSSLFMTLGVVGNWDFVLPFRGAKLAGLVIVACGIAISTILFQTVTNNRILTPGIMGFDALFALIQTCLVFAKGAVAASAVSANLLFAVEVAIMTLFSTALFGALFSGMTRSLHLTMLVGVVGGIFFRSLSALMQRMISPNEFVVLQDRLFASFNTTHGELLVASAIAIMVAAVSAWRLSPTLDVLSLGRETAINLGVDHRRTVMTVLVLVSILVSVSTALVGPVTFLGLLVASLARQIVPSARHVHLLPAAAALAVVGLVGGQMALERVFGFATALSIIVEFVGGIVFIVLVLKGAAR